MEVCSSLRCTPNWASGSSSTRHSRAAGARFSPFPTSSPRRRQGCRRCRPAAAAAAAEGSAGRLPLLDGLAAAGPASPPPDYSAIDTQPLNRAVYSLFRGRMVQAIGSDSQQEGWVAACRVHPQPGHQLIAVQQQAQISAVASASLRLHPLPSLPVFSVTRPSLISPAASTHSTPARVAPRRRRSASCVRCSPAGFPRPLL